MRLRIAGSLAACMLAAPVLTGCGESRGVTIPPGYENLATCASSELPISALADEGAPGRDLEGSTITFDELEGRFDVDVIRTNPDGVPALTITSVGASFAQGDGQGRELLMVNWGIPGVGVALIDNGELAEIWASTDEALELHRLAVQSEGIALE